MNRSDTIMAVESVPLGPNSHVLICGNCGGRFTFKASTALRTIQILCTECGEVYEFDRDTGDSI